ncbi:MAG: N-methyl-L-tryptophan oxidase [Planctomycetota bacterium]
MQSESGTGHDRGHSRLRLARAGEPRAFDAIVVGLGAMGSSALSALARRGKRVLGIDRFAPPHEHGSSHGGSRVIRLSYFEHPDYVPLLRHAYEGFDRLSRVCGERLRHETGLVVGGPAGNAAVAGMLRSAREHDLAVDALDGADLARRFPQFTVRADDEIVFESRGGFVRPEATIRAALTEARAAGAELELALPIDTWRSEGDGVRVETARGDFVASSLVLATGAWMPEVLGRDAPALRPTRETILWLDDEGDASWQSSAMPVWLFDRGAQPAVYGVPAFPGMGAPKGMKVGLHGAGPDAAPDSIREPVDPLQLMEAHAAVAERVRDAGGREIVAAKHCLYTMSADTDFVVGLHPGHANVAVACGFSGHGFKFAPVIGDALADLALDRATALPIGFLAPTRTASQWRPR